MTNLGLYRHYKGKKYRVRPDKLLDFAREIDVETDCTKCIHNQVCDHNMEKRCENYQCGTSVGNGCQSCLHRYTRWDKDAVPCFTCPWFEAKKA